MTRKQVDSLKHVVEVSDVYPENYWDKIDHEKWKVVDFRVPKPGENWVVPSGVVALGSQTYIRQNQPRLIVKPRKRVKYVITLLEDEQRILNKGEWAMTTEWGFESNLLGIQCHYHNTDLPCLGFPVRVERIEE